MVLVTPEFSGVNDFSWGVWHGDDIIEEFPQGTAAYPVFSLQEKSI
jgi:hypothetical protein